MSWNAAKLSLTLDHGNGNYITFILPPICQGHNESIALVFPAISISSFRILLNIVFQIATANWLEVKWKLNILAILVKVSLGTHTNWVPRDVFGSNVTPKVDESAILVHWLLAILGKMCWPFTVYQGVQNVNTPITLWIGTLPFPFHRWRNQDTMMLICLPKTSLLQNEWRKILTLKPGSKVILLTIMKCRNYWNAPKVVCRWINVASTFSIEIFRLAAKLYNDILQR